MKNYIMMITALLSTSLPTPKNGLDQISEVIHTAVNDPIRSDETISRDIGRKPLEVMMFSQIKPGDAVIEITPGGGYYTALLSRVVGQKGVIYAIDPKKAFQFLPRIRTFFTDYIKTDPRANVQYSIQHLDQITVPQQVDQIWMVLYYHDTFWTGENRGEMNEKLFKALKPGGFMLIVDHHARKVDGTHVTRNLHRIDEEVVMQEITAAGFVLDEVSDLLANPNDPRTQSVFDKKWRGKTDRFLWRFKKPVTADKPHH